MFNRRTFIAVMVVVFLGTFFRFYQYKEYLHFGLDQARDAIIIQEALENGPQELPLLGPRAAGSFLRLGPFFYYLTYFSALLFQDIPVGMSIIGTILSIFTIPLFYWYLRFYFSKTVSLATTLISSVSVFLVTYGRFTWNPNFLPFFILIFAISLLLAFSRNIDDSFKKNPWLRRFSSNFWLSLAFLSLGIIMQLHFLSFIAFPIITLIFIVINEGKVLACSKKKIAQKIGLYLKRFSYKKYILPIFLVFLINFPVVINEYFTQGQNFQELLKTVHDKNNKGQDHNNFEKLFRNIQEYANGYLLMITGLEKTDFVKFTISLKDKEVDLGCDKQCRNRLPFSFLAIVFFMGGVSWIFHSYYKKKVLLKRAKMNFMNRVEKDRIQRKANFLLLNILIFTIPFFIFLPVAFKFPPRFLLITSPIPFVFLAFWLIFFLKIVLKINKQKKDLALVLMLILVFVIFCQNVSKNLERFEQLASASTKNPLEFERDLILKEDIRFPYGEQIALTQWMVDASDTEIIFLDAPSKYLRSLIFHLDYRFKREGRKLKQDPECQEAGYFMVLSATSQQEEKIKTLIVNGKYEINRMENKGYFIIYQLKPKDLSFLSKNCSPLKKTQDKNKAKRYLIREIFN